MDRNEKQSIERLNTIVDTMRKENAQFRNDMTEMVLSINSKVDKKHTPLTLEQDILKTTQQAIGTAISGVLSGYASPLTKLVVSVIESHNDEVKKLINDAFTSVIRTDEFKSSIVNAFSHKVARTIISNNDGLFDKVANELKQDAIFKSRMSLAISNVVDECLRERELTK